MRRALSFLAILLVIASPLAAESYLIEANGNLPTDLDALVAAAGGTLVRSHDQIDVAVAQSDDPSFGANLEASSNKIKSCTPDPLVQWTPDPEATFELTAEVGEATTVDPTTAAFYSCQWNLTQIDAEGAWAQGHFGDGIKVVVIDSGIDPTHNEMVGKVDVAQSASTLSPGSSPCGAVDETTILDFRFHGTFVASQIVTNNLGIAGVAPLTEIVAVKSLNCTGSGSFGDVIAGILYAADLPDVSVINMSLGAVFPRTGAGSLISAMNKAVNYANSQGKLVVSSSGNEGLDLQHSGNIVSLPAEAGAGISIYATGIDGTLASYSNHGVSSTWVGAPGGDSPNPLPPLPGCVLPQSIQSLVVGACSSFQVSLPFSCGTGSYVLGTGTSFAAPLVAGVAALVDGKAGGSLGPAQLKTNLKNTADDLGATGTDNLYSHGRVNASSAVQ